MQRFLLLTFLSIIAAAPAAADEFYLVRLRAGEEAYRAKRFTEAGDQLRIACFGLLDQPPLLVEGLAHLALAQAAAGRTADADATLVRFVEVERTFGAYAAARLEPPVRAEFEALAAKRLSADTLLSLAALARLVETPAQKLAKLPPKERQKALEALAQRDPKDAAWPLELARDAALRDDQKAVVAWAGTALSIDPKNADALALRGHARTARKEYGPAREDLASLSPERVASEPQLGADLFVCEVASKEWDAARARLGQLPETVRTRPDVVAALKKLPRAPAEATAERRGEKLPDKTAARPVDLKAAEKPAEKPVEKSPGKTPEKRGGDPPLAPPVPEIVPQARKLTADGKAAEAEKILLEAARKAPPGREHRKALLEAACLSKDWKTAAQQAGLLEPFRDGEEAFAFYAAVALFESGSTDPARVLMARARPKIASSPYVDYYSKRILGTP